MPTPNRVTSIVEPSSSVQVSEMRLFLREKWQDLVAIGGVGTAWIVTAIVGI